MTTPSTEEPVPRKSEHDRLEDGELEDESENDMVSTRPMTIEKSAVIQEEKHDATTDFQEEMSPDDSGVLMNEEENDGNRDDDDSELTKIIAEYSATPAMVLDPKLCHHCKKNPHKYRCPKCNCRTCSLDCSKQHKEEKNCDGIQGVFNSVSKLSEFNDSTSVGDQKFFHSIKEAVKTETNELGPKPESHQADEGATTADGRRYYANSAQERYLSQNAYQRRIWLNFTDDKGGPDNSRHEQHSDTIFWTIDLTFRKQMADGTVSNYTYRVHQVPETIRVVTVIRQFLKPRPFGPLVSKEDLDLDKLAPFIEKGIEHVNVFMTIPMFEYSTKFYPVPIDLPFIDSTRNRLIVNHPQWVVMLDDEFMDVAALTLDEMEALSEKLRQERLVTNQAHSGRGGFRGSRGGGRPFRRGSNDSHRGNWRGRGGWNRDGNERPSYRPPHNTFDPRPQQHGYGGDKCEKRRGDFQHGNGRDFKRGRRDASRGNRWNDHQNSGRRSPSFDPFEPFEGPGAVHVDRLSDGGEPSSQ